MMRDLFGWFRRYVLRRVTVTASTAHWLCAGDGFKISQSQSGTYDGEYIVTRIVDATSFEARRYRRSMSSTHRYLFSMLLSFGSGMFQVATASRLAADGSVTAWVGVAVLGVILFFQFAIMALVSIEAERAAEKGAA